MGYAYSLGTREAFQVSSELMRGKQSTDLNHTWERFRLPSQTFPLLWHSDVWCPVSVYVSILLKCFHPGGDTLNIVYYPVGRKGQWQCALFLGLPNVELIGILWFTSSKWFPAILPHCWKAPFTHILGLLK